MPKRKKKKQIKIVIRAIVEIVSINHQALCECFRLKKLLKLYVKVHVVFVRLSPRRSSKIYSYINFCLRNFRNRNDKREIPVMLRKHCRDQFAT